MSQYTPEEYQKICEEKLSDPLTQESLNAAGYLPVYRGHRFTLWVVPSDVGHPQEQSLLVRNIDMKPFWATYKVSSDISLRIWMLADALCASYPLDKAEQEAVDRIGHKLFFASFGAS